MNKKIAFIGCGNMGEALLKGILDKRLFKPSDVIITDIRSSRRGYIRKTYHISAISSNIEAVKRSDIIILAVKPKDIPLVIEEIGAILKNKLIITIAAGITIKYIMQKTDATRIIKAMPNTPALVGAAITAISFAKGARSSDIKISDMIFSCAGEIVHLDERHINAVTAVSGSGPAYIFLLMEAMIDAAISLGIKPDIAEKLVTQTAVGTAALHHKTGEHPSILRQKVTSKGGTTEAALKVFEKYGFEKIIKTAIEQAVKRAKELSR